MARVSIPFDSGGLQTTSKSSRLETLPSDAIKLTLEDLINEGVQREAVGHLTKSHDLKNPLLNLLKEILLTPIALPTNSNFKALLDAEHMYPPNLPIPDDYTANKITIPEKDIILELNPLTIHSKVANKAIATSKMRSFATGVHALKPDIADGFLAMKSEDVAFGADYVAVDLSTKPFSKYKENEKVKLGDASHLLLDTVVELKKDEDDRNQILAKVIGELAIISSVLQYITKMNDLVTFGYLIARESVDLFVMHPLKALPLTQKKEADASEPITKAEPRLQSTQLFHWDLKEDIEFFKFAIFLWRIRAIRLSNNNEVEAIDTVVVNKAMANNNNNSGGSSGQVTDLGANSSVADAMDVEYHPNVFDKSKSCSNPKLLQCLSDHTRAKVFLMTLDGQQMVVKQFSDDNLDLFEREQTIYKKLKGLPCVPRMLSVPMENSFGLEYVRGVHYFTTESLKDVLQYMVLLLKAICDIHSRNVIHSDIKFANVIYDSTTKSLKVIDFAYSVQAEYKNGLQYCEGSTTHYAAPEVRNTTRVGFASDIYSAGMMFVSLLYGIKIVNEEDDKMFHQLVNRMDNKFKSREASYIARQMIARDWVQRSTAEELIDQILCIQPDITSLCSE